MNHIQSEALIVHGGGLTSDGELMTKPAERMRIAVTAWHNDIAPNLVATGGYSFMLDRPPHETEAAVMQRYALNHGLPVEAIFTEEDSLDTVGNVLFTKQQVVMPNEWERLSVVTSRSHLPRTLKIYRHIMGDEYDIQGIPAPEKVTVSDRIYEKIGATMMNEVLRGTKPGDDDAIHERLFNLVPGYGDGTKANLAIQSVLGSLRAR